MDLKRHVLSKSLLNQRGQSLVEYIMILGVVASLATLLFRSDAWQSYFGDNGKFERIFRAKMEYSYRHSMEGDTFYADDLQEYTSKNHDSYYSGQASRFYRPTDPYPEE